MATYVCGVRTFCVVVSLYKIYESSANKGITTIFAEFITNDFRHILQMLLVRRVNALNIIPFNQESIIDKILDRIERHLFTHAEFFTESAIRDTLIHKSFAITAFTSFLIRLDHLVF